MKKEKYTIITGSNSGIGKKSLHKFASNGHHVIMGCRDMESGQEALNETLEKYPNSKISLYKLDLADFSSVREFSEVIKNNFSHIDNIIHNAGFFNHGETKFQESADGFELTYQVNLLSPFLLNHLISPVLEKSFDPKIIYASTTNIKYFFDPKRKVNWEDLKPNSDPYNSYKMYGDSKICQLALVFLDTGMPVSVKSSAVMIPAVKIDKRTRKRMKPIYRFLAFLQYPFALNQEKIAECYYYLSENKLDKVLINSKKEIMKPVSYSDNPKEQIMNIIRDKTFPDYCLKQDFQKSLVDILTRLK